jgi:hypothetical protein
VVVRVSTKTKAWISGHCNQGNPEHIHRQCDEHPRTDGTPCSCYCHWEPATPEPIVKFDPENPTGFHHGLDEQVYHSHPTSLSVTGAKLLLVAPALFKYRQTHPEQNRVFDFGHAAHAKVLGVGAEVVVIQRTTVAKDGTETVADADDMKTVSAREHAEAIRAEGKTPMLRKELAVIDDMATELAKVPLIRDLMANGQPEVSAFCTDEPTGVMRRSRFDILDDILVDYKTTVSAEPGAFSRAAAKYGYAQQASWYRDIAEDLGTRPRGFLFIAQEKTAPYLTSVTEYVPDAIERGRDLNRRALERFRDCVESGHWPGYGTGITPIDLPRYAYYDQESS